MTMSKNLYNFYIMAFIIKNTKLPLIIFPVFTVNTKKKQINVFTLLQKKSTFSFTSKTKKKSTKPYNKNERDQKTKERHGQTRDSVDAIGRASCSSLTDTTWLDNRAVPSLWRIGTCTGWPSRTFSWQPPDWCGPVPTSRRCGSSGRCRRTPPLSGGTSQAPCWQIICYLIKV